MSIGGAHRIAINALGFDVLAAAALNGVIQAEDHRTGWGKGLDQQAQQQPGRLACAPASPTEHAMIVDEVALATEAGDTQDAGHGALTGCQDGSDEQDLGMTPGSVAKERGKRYNDRGEAGGQVRHGGVSWRKRAIQQNPVRLYTGQGSVARLVMKRRKQGWRNRGRSITK